MVTERALLYADLGRTPITDIGTLQEQLIHTATPFDMEAVVQAARAEQPPNIAMIGLAIGVAALRKRTAIATSNYPAANQWSSVCKLACDAAAAEA